MPTATTPQKPTSAADALAAFGQACQLVGQAMSRMQAGARQAFEHLRKNRALMEYMRWANAMIVDEWLYIIRFEYDPRELFGVHYAEHADTILGGTPITDLYITIIPTLPLHVEFRRRVTRAN